MLWLSQENLFLKFLAISYTEEKKAFGWREIYYIVDDTIRSSKIVIFPGICLRAVPLKHTWYLEKAL